MSKGLFGDLDPVAPDPADEEPGPDAPLADRMRPSSLDEVVGQAHLVGEGRILRKALEGTPGQSWILWGPPGCGKTTLARLIARASGMRFVPFSAVLSGIKEVRAVMAEAQAARGRGACLVVVDPRNAGLARKAQRADRIFRRKTSGRIRKISVFFRIKKIDKHGLVLVRQVYATHCDRHHLGPSRFRSFRILGVSLVFPGADDQARRKLAAGDFKRRCHGSAPSHELNDLDLIPIGKRRILILRLRHDLEIALNGDLFGLQLQRLKQSGDASRRRNLRFFAVDGDIHRKFNLFAYC